MITFLQNAVLDIVKIRFFIFNYNEVSLYTYVYIFKSYIF